MARKFARVLGEVIDKNLENYYFQMRMNPKKWGAPADYDLYRIGFPFHIPYADVGYGGVAFPIPMMGRGYQSPAWERKFAPPFPLTPRQAYLAADPWQQMVYGYLISMGYPVLGPSYKDRMVDEYGRGSEGMIGFGKSERGVDFSGRKHAR